ncbi:pyruvoyl-dependent arginine decarboxylase [Desulforudis sp. 1088]|uniref:pyruvoyl-dependent arginine decarboxylase n=1 Tax=unclassified Candidatus Desulforudis TaxID=2635950 RepID=UPI00346FB65A
MLPVPRKYFVTAACAEGETKLNAFDNALLAGRIGNVNLIRVSSILPPGAEYDPDLKLPLGALVPTAYGAIISNVPGELLAAAVGVGLSADTFGVIMEFSGKCTREEAYSEIDRMLEEAFRQRKMELVEKKIVACEHRVIKVGCCLAAVPMWY